MMFAASKRSVVMPHAAGALASYDRIYAFDTIDGRRVIRGFYLRGHDNRTFLSGAERTSVQDVYLAREDEMPGVADGGCAFVSVYFDLVTHKLMRLNEGADHGFSSENAVCNGIA